MSLKKSTELLIIGIAYTVIHKILLFLFGSSLSDFMFSLFDILWLMATFTIILFCHSFLKEVSFTNIPIQISLKGVIIFTAIIMFFKIPFEPMQIILNSAYILFDLSRFFIVLLLFIFLINFYTYVNDELKTIKFLSFILILGFGISTIFGLISNFHYINFIFTGNVLDPLDPLAPIANIAGLVTLITEFFFLFHFRKINDYKNILAQYDL